MSRASFNHRYIDCLRKSSFGFTENQISDSPDKGPVMQEKIPRHDVP